MALIVNIHTRIYLSIHIQYILKINGGHVAISNRFYLLPCKIYHRQLKLCWRQNVDGEAFICLIYIHWIKKSMQKDSQVERGYKKKELYTQFQSNCIEPNELMLFSLGPTSSLPPRKHFSITIQPRVTCMSILWKIALIFFVYTTLRRLSLDIQFMYLRYNFHSVLTVNFAYRI